MLIPLFALLLAVQEPAAAAQPAPEPAPAAGELPPVPAGAPSDDYGLIAWCYGALAGHMELEKQVMPEVERIERQFPDPSGGVAAAMQGYKDQMAEGRAQLKVFRAATEAAERASPQPINARGAEAVKAGRGTWRNTAGLSKRQVAQLWMSWALPARCVAVAEGLQQRASLMGEALRGNSPEAAPPETGADAAASAPAAPTDAPAEAAVEPSTPTPPTSETPTP